MLNEKHELDFLFVYVHNYADKNGKALKQTTNSRKSYAIQKIHTF